MDLRQIFDRRRCEPAVPLTPSDLSYLYPSSHVRHQLTILFVWLSIAANRQQAAGIARVVASK